MVKKTLQNKIVGIIDMPGPNRVHIASANVCTIKS